MTPFLYLPEVLILLYPPKIDLQNRELVAKSSSAID